MVSNLPSSLDSLYSNGIINFDAESYIKGPGSPQSLPFDQPLNVLGSPAANLHGQPKNDAFVNSAEGHEAKEGPADWKKAATAVLLGGLAIFGGAKIKSKVSSIINKVKAANTATNPAAASTTATAPSTVNAISLKIKSAIASVKTAVQNIKTKIIPSSPAAVQKIKTWVSNAAAKIKALPKWGKIVGGAAVALLALTGLKPSQKAEQTTAQSAAAEATIPEAALATPSIAEAPAAQHTQV